MRWFLIQAYLRPILGFFSINWLCSLVSSVRHEAAYCIHALHFLEDSMITRYLLSSHLTWLSPCLVAMRQRILAYCFLQRTMLFSSFFFYILDCNIFVSFWNLMDCNKVVGLVFISSWGDIYVMFNLIPTHFIVLRTVGKRFGLQFTILLLSLSMVRGHKAQALWPMASPLNPLSGQHFSCIVKHMVWIIPSLFFVVYDHNGLFKYFLWSRRGWCLFSFLSPLNFTIGINMKLIHFRGLLIYSNIKNMLLHDSFGSIGTTFEKFHYIILL